MKTKIFLLCAVIFFSASTFAQHFSLGIKGGANLGKITGHTFKDEFKLGYQIGGFATIPLGKVIAIQPEVLFNQTNVDTSNRFSDIYQFNKIDKIELNQILIPVMVNFNINRVLTLQVGPQFDVVINQDKNLLQNGGDAFRGGNFAGAAGVQLNLMKFRIYGRFTGGITNMDNIGEKENWKVQNIQVGVGLSL